MTIRLAVPYSRRAVAAGLVALVAIAAPACEESPTSPGTASRLTVMLTDAPLEEVQQVNVFFTGVTVKPFGKSVEHLDLQLATNPVDLLTLDHQVVALAAGAVDPGDYEFIQVEIDPARSGVVVDGAAKPLSVPSKEVKILGTFTVGENGTDLTLDFDASKSLLPLGNGGWLLKPVIVKVNTGESSQTP